MLEETLEQVLQREAKSAAILKAMTKEQFELVYEAVMSPRFKRLVLAEYLYRDDEFQKGLNNDKRGQ